MGMHKESLSMEATIEKDSKAEGVEREKTIVGIWRKGVPGGATAKSWGESTLRVFKGQWGGQCGWSRVSEASGKVVMEGSEVREVTRSLIGHFSFAFYL